MGFRGSSGQTWAMAGTGVTRMTQTRRWWMVLAQWMAWERGERRCTRGQQQLMVRKERRRARGR